MRSLRPILASLGVLAIIAAAVLRFVIVPGQAQWPDDVDSTRAYSGTLNTLLSADALAAGDLANLFVQDVPVSIERRVTTESVADGRATVNDASTVTAPDGTILLSSATLLGIDRTSMDAVDTVGDTTLPAREGLVIGFPIGTEARDYTGWSDEIGQTTTLEYVGEVDRAGITAYEFHMTIDAQRIVDADTLSQFPPALPLALAQQLLPALGATELATQFEQLAASGALPDPIPLAYTLTDDLRTWIDPATGMTIDVERSQTRTVAVEVAGLTVPVTAVFDWQYAQTEASVAEAVQEAQDNGARLTLYGTTLPVTLLVLGVVFLAAAILLRGNRRHDDVMRLPEISKETRTPDEARVIDIVDETARTES